MATGRVRAGFYHIRTRPAGQDRGPNPTRLLNGFFSGTRTRPHKPHEPRGPRPHDQSSPAQNQKQNFFFERESKQKF